ncbi:hypothetical protein BT69DRAFT_1273347 [Atractiella rhizophila]|nr:hypothetical protein BT69DRAFT_1273347 [Atractiella rhizophila]
MSVNSSIKFDYSSVSFGLDKVQSHFLHTNSRAPRYVKMFKRNPPIDGSGWKQGVEITFSLQVPYVECFLQTFRKEGERWGIEGDIEVWKGEESKINVANEA